MEGGGASGDTALYLVAWRVAPRITMISLGLVLICLVPLPAAYWQPHIFDFSLIKQNKTI